jgi:phosphatidylinositol 4-kinase
LALQFIKHFQRIFKQNDLDLFVAPYRCISNRTGAEKLLGGIIEVVPNSHSRDQLGKAFEINLHEYFLKKYGTESTSEFKTARYNFIRSLAAYAVVSFILQIKDRHNGNILIDESGHLIHIDFGFIFDWSPGKDMKFESAAFKLTQEFIDILGGSSSAPAFRLFENMVIQGYLAVREHSDDFLGLTELMFYSGFPCFKPFSL